MTAVTAARWEGQPLDAICIGAWQAQPAQPAIRREGLVSPVGARTTAQSHSGQVSTYMICILAYRQLGLEN
jgi:hypothetical protein